MWPVLFSVSFLSLCQGLELPDMSGINGELTSSLNVDQFFSLWIVFNEDDVNISGGCRAWHVWHVWLCGFIALWLYGFVALWP